MLWGLNGLLIMASRAETLGFSKATICVIKALTAYCVLQKRKDLTATEGHVLALEYMEETPLILNRPGQTQSVSGTNVSHVLLKSMPT